MRTIALLFILGLSIPAIGQDFFKEPFIEVSGIAEMEVDPNEITLWIRLKEFEENKNKVQLEKLDQGFMTALKNAGIDRKRLTIADAGSTLSKVTKRDKATFREKTYELILNGAAELEKLLTAIEPVEIDMVRITKIDHTDMEKFKIDVKIKALHAAKAKATTLAKSIDMNIGKPLMIREWDEGPVYPMVQANLSFKRNMESDAVADDPVGFRKIKLRAQVTAQFEIR